MRKQLPTLRTDEKSIEFGRIASQNEINLLNSKVKSLKSKVRSYDKILSTVKDVVTDLPKLDAYSKSRWRDAKTNVSRAKKDLAELEPKLNIAIASRKSLIRMPSVMEILKYAEKNDLEPSRAINDFNTKFVERLYPEHVELMARDLNRLERTFKNADEPHFDSGYDAKIKWLDKAVIKEDATYPKGANPISKIVIHNKDYFKKLINKLTGLESNYVQDAIKDHLGQGTSKFSNKDIKNITGIDFQDLQPKSQWEGVIDPNAETELGGFLSKLFKIVLSPAQIFGGSVFSVVLKNTVGSSIVRKNIPSGLYNALSGLSQASANIAVGKVSKENLRKAIKYSIKTVGETGKVVGKAYNEALKVYYGAYYMAMKTETGRQIDKYTGGLATSAINLSQVQGDVLQQKKIDVTARAIDAIKVGSVLVGGSVIASVATSAGTRVASEKTALGKTSIGRGIISAGAIYAGGGGSLSDVAKKVVVTKATSQATKQVTRKLTPTLTKALGSKGASLLTTSISKGITSQVTGDGNFTSTATKSLASEGSKSVVSSASKKILGDKVGSIVGKIGGDAVGGAVGAKVGAGFSDGFGDDRGVIVGETGIDGKPLMTSEGGAIVSGTDGTMFGKTSPSFLETIGKNINEGVKSEAIKQGVTIADQYTGGKASKAYKTAVMVDKYKDMTPEEFKQRVQDEISNAENRIIEERMLAEQRIDKVMTQITEADSEEAKKKLMKKVEEEERRLENKANEIKDNIDKGIKKAGEDYNDFDTKQFLDDESRRLKGRILAEKDRFTANATNRLFDLGKKYGPKLLAYLMWKYGPRADYDDVMTREDQSLYMNYVPRTDGRLYSKRPWGLGKKIGLLVGLVVGAKVVMG